VGRSSPCCEDVEEILLFNKFFADCLNCEDIAVKVVRWCADGEFLEIFWVLYFQRAVCSTFQTCILNLYYGHAMCRSVVDIQSATTEIRRGKKRKERKKQDKNIMSASAMQGGHNN